VTGECRACGRPITYARLANSGKTVALDVGRWPDGYLDVLWTTDHGSLVVRLMTIVERDGRPMLRAHKCNGTKR
jgi:hypothetical protein